MSIFNGLAPNGVIPVGDGPVVNWFNGLPLNEEGAVVVAETLPTHFHGDLPFDDDGNICVSRSAPTRFENGLAFTADNQLALSAGPATGYSCGTPYADNGALVANIQEAPPEPQPEPPSEEFEPQPGYSVTWEGELKDGTEITIVGANLGGGPAHTWLDRIDNLLKYQNLGDVPVPTGSAGYYAQNSTSGSGGQKVKLSSANPRHSRQHRNYRIDGRGVASYSDGYLSDPAAMGGNNPGPEFSRAYCRMFVHFSAQPPAHAIKWFRIWGADDKNRICSITTDGGSYIKFGQTGGADSTRFWKQARPPANTWTVMEIYVDVPAGGATGFIQNRMANKPINTLTDATRNLTGRGHRFAIMGYDAGSEPEEPKLPVIDIGEIYCADSEARVLVTESSDWTAIGNKQELCELVEWGNGRIKVKLCLGQFADATDKKLILVRHDRSVVFVGTFKTSEAPPIPVPPETGFDPAPGYDVRGDFRPDGVITIKRDRGAFGQGPTVVMFDDHRSGSPGDQAPLMSTIGSWSKYRDGSLGPIIAEGGRTGNCISVWNPDGATNARQLARELVTGQTFSEFYVSYCMRFRDGKNADTPNKYGSNLKSVWFTNGGPGNTPGGAANMDIHCLSWPDVTNSVLSGNNAYQSVYLIPRTFWSKTKWNMIQIWLKPGDPIGDANDYVYARLDTTDAMRERVRDDRRVYKADRPKELKWFGVLGWAGNLDDPHTFDPLMDDIYLAIGPHSAARVMLGNASTWAGCTDFALATPVEWKDGELTVRLRAGPWTDFTGKHLYVVNEDNSPEYAGEITGE